jgi:hypothetical protein
VVPLTLLPPASYAPMWAAARAALSGEGCSWSAVLPPSQAAAGLTALQWAVRAPPACACPCVRLRARGGAPPSVFN